MERPEDRRLDFVFPPPDRLASLIQAYFDTWNPLFPMFHRHLFEKQLINEQFVHDKQFGVAVLLICALAESGLSGDAEQTSQRDHRPLGWSLFLQAEPFLRMPTPAEPQLLDIQIFLLAAFYMAFVKGNFAAWTLFGTAIRLGYLANAHRRDKYRNGHPNLPDELWKRTFWSLVVNDRTAASIFGQPLMMKDETFDLDLPLEVDDECWDIETAGFPLQDRPVTDQGSLSFFVANVRLWLILGVSLRTLYSINRSRLLMGFVGSDWEQRITRNIDQMLDEWMKTVPTHLQWDPDTKDLNHFMRSSFLTAKYCAVRIHAHNPFVRTTARGLSQATQSSRNTADLTSSLTICTEAAVNCSQLMNTVMERHPRALRLPGWAEPAWLSGLVLLINLFGFKSSLDDADIRQFITYVEACLDALTIVSVDDSVGVQRKRVPL
ncbi:fungal-specific transcription factor domain-containing protein [Auriculariales sp. MPI-PUGE-AT-0066]|nr:fungal-specific transcription factor domain-containing protein [Auriculariales sp. MPI-PUGE-AT-0066]